MQERFETKSVIIFFKKTSFEIQKVFLKKGKKEIYFSREVLKMEKGLKALKVAMEIMACEDLNIFQKVYFSLKDYDPDIFEEIL